MSDSPRQRFDALVARAGEADSVPPFSEAALLAFEHGERDLVWLDDAVALATLTDAEFVVAPEHRGQGQGRAMLELLQSTRSSLDLWAHGDHTAAQALASATGFERTTTLLHLRGAVFESDIPGVKAFRDDDVDEWLELNARIFADFPEQGSMTRRDLERIMNRPWFTPDDFLVMREHGRMVAFAFLKVEGALGEIYVLGVDPERQKSGLVRTMVEAAFVHLADQGIRSAHVYVEGSNQAAVRLYRSMGFYDHSVDVKYRWSRS